MPRHYRRISLAGLLVVSTVVILLGIRAGLATLKIGGVTVTRNDVNTFNQLTNNGADAIASEIFDKMAGSTETFSFTGIPSAQLHFQAREQIITAMNSYNGGAVLVVIDFDYPGTGSVQYPGFGTFIPVDAKATSAMYEFKVASTNIKTSVAVQTIEQGRTRSDCAAAAASAFLIGHRRAYGNAWIDGMIPAGALTIDTNLYFSAASGDTATYIPGDLMYMSNKSDYLAKAEQKKTKIRVWQGENAIYSGGGTFSGLGLYNRSEAQMRGDLAAGYFTDTGIRLDPNTQLANITFVTFFRVAIQP